MPECHRCERVYPSGELRRTSKGYVCKDAVSCKRRLSLTKSAVLDSAIADRLMLHARDFNDHADGHDPLHALRVLNVLMTDVQEAALDILQRAARETRLTQKQLAAALGMPASTLSGLRSSTH